MVDDLVAIANLLRPQIEPTLRQMFESDPRLVDELDAEARRAHTDEAFRAELHTATRDALEADEAFHAELHTATRDALEADEDFIAEVRRVADELPEGS